MLVALQNLRQLELHPAAGLGISTYTDHFVTRGILEQGVRSDGFWYSSVISDFARLNPDMFRVLRTVCFRFDFGSI